RARPPAKVAGQSRAADPPSRIEFFVTRSVHFIPDAAVSNRHAGGPSPADRGVARHAENAWPRAVAHRSQVYSLKSIRNRPIGDRIRLQTTCERLACTSARML